MKHLSTTGACQVLRRCAACAGLVAFATHAATSAVAADPIVTLENANSEMSVNLASPDGVSSWTVDGRNILAQQWYWFGVNSQPFLSLDMLGSPSYTQPSDSTLQAMYSGNALNVGLFYSLVGGATGSGRSSFSQQVRIENITDAPLTLELLQYARFNFTSSQAEVSYNVMGDINQVWIPEDGSAMTLDVELTPGANLAESGVYPPGTPVPTGMRRFGIPVGGPLQGDLRWCIQLDPGETFLLGESCFLDNVPQAEVPEPSPALLLTISLAFAWPVLRRNVRPERDSSN